MIKLLLKTLVKYIDSGHKKTRDSAGKSTVVIYEIAPKNGKCFTRIDIFTRQ